MLRKVVKFTRKLFLILALFFIAVAICSIDSIPATFPLINLGISAICFGIAVALDQLYWHIAWNTNDLEV